MRLASFQVRRYRVFDSEITIPLSDFTVLTGPNNLGKSTVLRALDLFFNDIGARQRSIFPARFDRSDRSTRYDPDVDYPKLYEGKPGRRYSTRLATTIEFTNADIQQAQSLSLTLPTQLSVILEYNRQDDRLVRQVTVPFFQRQEDVDTFLRWFTSNFRYLYIPANRNVADFRRTVFSEIVASTIQNVRRSRQRVQALDALLTDVRTQLSHVEDQLTSDLKPFLPDLKQINLILDQPEILDLISLADVEIDDGAKTSITQKGDGVKSLFVMSILQFLAKQNYQRNLVFAIEEPEAHLHSSAIYDTKASLRSLSQSFQILISTHSPILIQRDTVSANIIIDRTAAAEFICTARPARTLSQIRNSLGIRPHENLATAEVTIVVEGVTEERTLGKLLSHINPKIAQPYDEGRIRVISAGGASKAISVLRALAHDAASCIVVLDADQPANDAIRDIKQSGLVNLLDVFQVPARTACNDTEFEDLFLPELYINPIASACGCAFTLQEFNDTRTKSGSAKTRMKKWSDVIETLVASSGKSFQDFHETIKEAFANSLLRDIPRSAQCCEAWLRSIATRVHQNLSEAR